MIVVEVVLAVCVAILFAVFVKQCERIERCEDNMGMSEAEIQELRRRCDAYKELIEALSKSVRELNGVVEEAVKNKEQTSDNKPDEKTYWLDDILDKIRKRKEKPIDATEKHDTEALVLGWNVDEIDEPELVSVEEFRKNIDSMACQRINPYTQQAIVNNLNCQNVYPWNPMYYYNGRFWGMP